MIKGIGTVINALAIIAAGILGVTCKRFIKESYAHKYIHDGRYSDILYRPESAVGE